MPPVKSPKKVFISYCHDDEKYLKKIKDGCSLLVRQGLVDFWYDRKIIPAHDLDQTIQKHLRSSDIFMILITQSFFASNYCYENEMEKAIALQKRGKIKLLGVIVKDCQWKKHKPISKFLCVPRDGKEITRFRPQDVAYTQIADGLETLINDLSNDQISNISEKPISKTIKKEPAIEIKSTPIPESALNNSPLNKPKVRKQIVTLSQKNKESTSKYVRKKDFTVEEKLKKLSDTFNSIKKGMVFHLNSLKKDTRTLYKKSSISSEQEVYDIEMSDKNIQICLFKNNSRFDSLSIGYSVNEISKNIFGMNVQFNNINYMNNRQQSQFLLKDDKFKIYFQKYSFTLSEQDIQLDAKSMTEIIWSEVIKELEKSGIRQVK